jgi:hypothetical protein
LPLSAAAKAAYPGDLIWIGAWMTILSKFTISRLRVSI